MHVWRWIAGCALIALVLSGCGGGSKFTEAPPPASPVPLSGNWQFGAAVGASATTSALIPPMNAGNLAVTGNQVSADLLAIPVFTATSTSCGLPSTPDVTLTGTVVNAKVSLTSAAWLGSVLSVSGTVSSDGQSIQGSWSAKGGCMDGESGSYSASYVPPLNGTWTGTAANMPSGLTGSTANSPLAGASITLQVQQSSTPQQYLFPLSGTVTVNGTGCGFTHGTLVQAAPGVSPVPSFVVGKGWVVEAQMDDGKSTLIAAGAPSVLSPAQWLMVMNVVGGACDQASAQANLQ